MGVKFPDWIGRRVGEYGFVEGQDFISKLRETSGVQGGRPSTEYVITLGMAKELGEFGFIEGQEFTPILTKSTGGRPSRKWISRRIEEYGFIEGQEFYSNLSKINPGRGRPSTDFRSFLNESKSGAGIYLKSERN